MKLTILKGNPRVIRVESTLTYDMLHTVEPDALKLVDKETKAVVFRFDTRDRDLSKYGIGFANAAKEGAIVMNFDVPETIGSTDVKKIKLWLGTVAASATKLEKQVTTAYNAIAKASEAIEVEE